MFLTSLALAELFVCAKDCSAKSPPKALNAGFLYQPITKIGSKAPNIMGPIWYVGEALAIQQAVRSIDAHGRELHR